MARMKDNDDLGRRMKAYEAVETERRLDPWLPIYARIDGRSFSSFTKGMDRPFDARMTTAMIETTKHLVHETDARIGYTQSDEISLVWLSGTPESDIIFSGRIQKLVSVLASMAAAKFATVCPVGFEHKLPHFDCRLFQLPTKEEAANALLWRAMDARKNAISMVAQSHFPHEKLQGKDQKTMLGMLNEIGIQFDEFSDAFRRGSFIQRFAIERTLTADELANIPKEHRPTGPVMRQEMRIIDMPPFNRVTNRVEVIFDGKAPSQSL